jgi:hypothetical protein
MTEAPDPKEVVIIEELVTSNMFKIEALIEVLAKKGIVNKKEILEVILRMKRKKK